MLSDAEQEVYITIILNLTIQASGIVNRSVVSTIINHLIHVYNFMCYREQNNHYEIQIQ